MDRTLYLCLDIFLKTSFTWKHKCVTGTVEPLAEGFLLQCDTECKQRSVCYSTRTQLAEASFVYISHKLANPHNSTNRFTENKKQGKKKNNAECVTMYIKKHQRITRNE